MAKEFKTLSDELIIDDLSNRVFQEHKVKEFIKILEARISNQLRIHWIWLKNKSSEYVTEFINNIIDKRAGENLI